MTETPKKKTLKGLADPQFISKDPLDVLFKELDNAFKLISGTKSNGAKVIGLLKDSLSNVSNPIDIATAKYSHDSVHISQIEIKGGPSAKHNEREAQEFQERYLVIETLLDKLIEIKYLTIAAKQKYKAKDTLMISLHDMKIFGFLVHLIVIQGVYAALPSNIGISLEKRRLNEFKKDKKGFKTMEIQRISNYKQQFELLALIINKLLIVFEESPSNDGAQSSTETNDVKDLLIKGLGYSDFLISALYLFHNPVILSKPSNWPALFNEIQGLSNTFELFELYSLLVGPGNVAPWFKQLCLYNIAHLPLTRKSSGVISLIEFLTGMRYNEEISIEKFDHVNRILLNKPQDVTTIDYFNNVSTQMYNILILVNRPILTSVCVNFIEALYKKNTRIVEDFYFKKIWYRCNPAANPVFAKYQNKHQDDDILIKGKDFDNLLNVFFSIVKNTNEKNIHLGLFTHNTDLIITLWNYLIFLQQKKLTKNVDLVFSIFKLYFSTTSDLDSLETILDNLFVGLSNYPWVFKLEFAEPVSGAKDIVTQSVAIAYQKHATKEFHLSKVSKELLFDNMNLSTDVFIDLIEKLENEQFVQKFFLIILKKWLLRKDRMNSIKLLIGREDDENAELIDSFKMLINMRLLQSMSTKFKNQLNNNADMLEVLEIIETVLTNYNAEKQDAGSTKGKKPQENGDEEDEVDSDDDMDDLEQQTQNLLIDNKEDEEIVINVALQLLASILSNSKLIDVKVTVKLDSVSAKLQEASRQDDNSALRSTIESLNMEISKIRQMTENLVKNLDNKDGSLSKQETIIKLNKIQEQYENDLQLYDKAMKNLSSQVIPIRAHGLQLVSQLVQNKSKILTLKEAIGIYLNQLHHAEPFIYLSSIRGLTSLVESNLRDALPLLLKTFSSQEELLNKNFKESEKKDDKSQTSDDKKLYNTDTITKIGEVLNNLILKYDEDPAYANQANRHSSQLFPAGLTTLLAGTLISVIKIDPLRHISNDIRISAISVLESCFRVNLNGIFQFLQDSLDVAIGVLTFETNDTPAEISMRRGAIKLVYGIVSSGSVALQEFPKGYGKKILARLGYVQDNDGDLLIKEQARDTLEEIRDVFRQSVFGDLV